VQVFLLEGKSLATASGRSGRKSIDLSHSLGFNPMIILNNRENGSYTRIILSLMGFDTEKPTYASWRHQNYLHQKI